MTETNNTISTYNGDVLDVLQAEIKVKYGRNSSKEDLRTIIAEDETMNKLFGRGDPLLVDVNVREFVGDGTYVFRVKNQKNMQFIRHLQHRPGEGYFAIPTNKNYIEIKIKKDELEVLGVVVKAWKSQMLG